MIHLIANAPDASTAAFVLAALRRSVSHGLAIQASHASLEDASIVVCVNADDRLGDAIIDWLNAKPRKLIMSGRLPAALHQSCGESSRWWSDQEYHHGSTTDLQTGASTARLKGFLPSRD
jgi:hypothetical protein